MDISVIIRAKNEAKKIGVCLERIFAQETDLTFEVIVIDSGSQDKTVAIVQQFPVRLYSIEPEEFNYGKALNDGVQWARGTYIVCCSAHAIPADCQWLEALVKPLRRDGRIAGVCSREVFDDECHPIEASRLHRTFPPLQTVYDLSFATNAEEKADIIKRMVFSNASSCIPRDLLLQYPFEHLSYGEDHAWAVQMLERGYRILYQPSSRIVHYHNETLPQVARRFRQIGRSQIERGFSVRLTNLVALFLVNYAADLRFIFQRERRLAARLRWSWRLALHWWVGVLNYREGAREVE